MQKLYFNRLIGFCHVLTSFLHPAGYSFLPGVYILHAVCYAEQNKLKGNIMNEANGLIINWNALVVMIIMLAACFSWLGYIMHKKTKKADAYWDSQKPENAEEKCYIGDPFSKHGFFTVYISPFQWVIVNWDADKEYLEICTPPDTHHHREHNHIIRSWRNWKIVSSKPPVKTTIEEHMKKRVM